jgi:hypothetical protein
MKIIIPSNRKRFPLILVISFFLTFGGAYNITREISEGLDEKISYLTYAILLLPGFFFIISLFEFLKTRFDKNASLIISDTGINDNLSIFSCGEIKWTDIWGVQIITSLKTDFLVIKVFDRMKYIKNKNFLQQYILKRLVRKTASPIVISQFRINYDLQELERIIIAYKKII